MSNFAALKSQLNLSAASKPQSSSRSSKNIVIEFTGVEEGNEFDFNSEETNFAYCDRLLDLYADKDEDNVKFEHFCIPTDEIRPKSGHGIFSPVLIDNLARENIVSMRPSQIAAMMAICFTPPCQTPFPPDFVCISSTGSGKTYAFLAPMIQKCLERIEGSPDDEKRTPLVLIFAHSNSLVINIYQKAMKLIEGTDVRIKLIAGGENYIRDDDFDIGICTIGRFKCHFDPENKQDVQIDISNLRYLVVDEADSMMAADEFYAIAKSLKEKVHPIILLYSATVNPSIYSVIDDKNYYAFGGGKINALAASISCFFWPVSSKAISKISGSSFHKLHVGIYNPKDLRHPFDALFFFLKDKEFNTTKNKKKVIVFMKRTTVADAITFRLNCYGFRAVAVHGKQPIDIRKILLQRFIDGEVKILVATHLLTRGTDINVEFVINYDLPLAYPEWVHRCGRTGRNRRRGVAISFIDKMNVDDYPPNTIRQIALHTDMSNAPQFMKTLAEIAKIQSENNEAEQEALEEESGF